MDSAAHESESVYAQTNLEQHCPCMRPNFLHDAALLAEASFSLDENGFDCIDLIQLLHGQECPTHCARLSWNVSGLYFFIRNMG